MPLPRLHTRAPISLNWAEKKTPQPCPGAGKLANVEKFSMQKGNHPMPQGLCGHIYNDSKIIGECMTGSVNKRKDTGAYYVQWYDKITKKTIKVTRYKGETMHSERIARKLLAQMQAAVENGTFVLERFTKKGWTDVVPFMKEWIEAVRPTLSPATYKGYKSYLRTHIIPYFKNRPELMLHDIQLDVITDFMNQLTLQPKGKMNVVNCLHVIMDFAKRSRRIVSMPSFPRKSAYQLIEKPIQWLPEKRQLNIIRQIPEDHQPIFYFLKYTMRRPAEACALHMEDYKDGIFTIRRSISARTVVDKTKTGEIHKIPCHTHLLEHIEKELKKPIISKFLFKNPYARRESKRYTNESLNIIWKKACKAAGEDIPLYSGTKHSSCSQYINEYGLSDYELQKITDHARLESIKRYAKTEVKRVKELMEKNIINIKDKAGQK
jgi:integrase